MTQILLLEDKPSDARLFEEYLKDSEIGSYKLFHADTLAEGIEISRQHNIDIIFVDLQLLDSDGIETFERIYHENPDRPIVVLTGSDESDLGLTAVKKGAQDFIVKQDLNDLKLSRTIGFAIERNQLLRRLELAQELAKMGNWEVNLKTNKFTCSRQILQIFGREENQQFTSLKDYLESVHPEDQLAVAQKLKNASSEGGEFIIDHRILLPNNEIKHVVLKGQLEYDQAGQANSLMGTTQDITERKRIETLTREKELATKAAKLRQEFLAKTSHEIRTPLNPILLLTGRLLETPLNEEQREYLSAIRIAGDTLLAVVNDILDLAKVEAGKIDFIRNPFHLSEVFDYLQDMMALNAREKGLEFHTELDANIPDTLIGDNVRLTQVLLNLVGNAIKFTHQGEIRVKAEALETTAGKCRVRFTVRDTGIGIPKDKLKLIFESFQQVDTDPNRRYGGTGLGLTIVRQLVKLQGGSVDVESAPNEGSCFRVELDFDLKQEVAQDSERVEIDKDRLRGLEVLLIEDNPLNQLVTKKLLSDWGIVLDIANNGREGVEKLADKGYDLVLMDVQMPEMDGYAATQHIRTKMEPPVRDIPIIALTANAFSGSDDECLRVGMDDYVSKPIEITNLYTKIVQHTLERYPDLITRKNGQATTPETVQEENGTQISMASEKYIDLSYLNEISGGDESLIRKTIEKFLETTPATLDETLNHLNNQAYQDLGRTVHKLKSSVAFMGMEQARDTILQIEHITKTNDGLDRLPNLVEDTRRILEQSYLELQEALDSM